MQNFLVVLKVHSDAFFLYLRLYSEDFLLKLIDCLKKQWSRWASSVQCSVRTVTLPKEWLTLLTGSADEYVGMKVHEILALAVISALGAAIKLYSSGIALHLRAVPLLEALVAECRGSRVVAPSLLSDLVALIRAALEALLVVVTEECGLVGLGL